MHFHDGPCVVDTFPCPWQKSYWRCSGREQSQPHSAGHMSLSRAWYAPPMHLLSETCGNDSDLGDASFSPRLDDHFPRFDRLILYFQCLIEIMKGMGYLDERVFRLQKIWPKVAQNRNTMIDQFLQEQMRDLEGLWKTCHKRVHRANSFRRAAQTTHILSLIVLFMVPSMFVISRVWAVRAMTVSLQLTITTIFVHYAASVDFHNCLMGVRDKVNRALQPTYRITYDLTPYIFYTLVIMVTVCGLPLICMNLAIDCGKRKYACK
ncbi:hypothetical protein CLF_101103 [Clonorchis sinensis]|uniref:Uncharacterized protein n=1 Tax=Clonorchis sinensis TaxID=79923 RepID=G7Y4Z9_CLOSI|nr:hypothetical protein CLF_101103 [Clonorchis sinensis]